MGHQHHQLDNFLVTLDIGEKIASLQTVGIKTPSPDSDFSRQIQDDLIKALEVAFEGVANILTVRMSDLAKEVLALAYKNCPTADSLIISTCHEFAEPMKGLTLDINRLIDSEGNYLGIGPRPGCPDLNSQIELIKAHANGKPVIIVEDGIFTGSTVSFVINLLKKAGVTVSHLIVGFRFEGSDRTVNAIKRQGVKVNWLQEFNNLLDWVPDHDFLPMIPNNGKVIGVDVFGQPMPYYALGGASFSIPYLYPFAPVEQWASVPARSQKDLAKKCLALSMQIYTKLELMNANDITIGDIIMAPQPVTLPVAMAAKPGSWSKRDKVKEYLNALTHAQALKLYSE